MSPSTPSAVPVNPQFQQLFDAYAGGNNSIGQHVGAAVMRSIGNVPLVAVSGSDIALFLGGEPQIKSFRLSTPGFYELAAISHLGPAMASLVEMAVLGDKQWAKDAAALRKIITKVMAANTVGYWAGLKVPAWQGKTAAIQRMVAYACDLTATYLVKMTQSRTYRTFAGLRKHYLEVNSKAHPVPFNDVMIATFCLTAINSNSEMLKWIRGYKIDWRKAMAVIAGEAGGPAAGVTRCSNHLYQLLQAASNNVLTDSQILVAPFLESFSVSNPPKQGWAALEQTYRRVWSSLHTRSLLAGRMFAPYPEFEPPPCRESVVTRQTKTVRYPPKTTSAKDLYAFVAPSILDGGFDPAAFVFRSVVYPGPANQDEEQPNQGSNSRVDWGGVSQRMSAISAARVGQKPSLAPRKGGPG